MSNRARRKRTRRSAEANGIADFKRKPKIKISAFSKIFRSPLLLSIPVVFYLLLGSIDFLILLSITDSGLNLFHIAGQPIFEDEHQRYAAEVVKLNLYLYLYAFISILMLFNIKPILRQMCNHKNFLIIFVILLSGYFVSDESGKVLTNVIHLAFGAASALLFSTGQLGKPKALRNTYLVVLLPMLFILTVSVLLLFYQGSGMFGFLSEGKRYAGIAGNPNTLGGLCVLGLWSAMSMIYISRSKLPIFLLALVALFVLGLVLSGSTTAAVVSLIIAVVLIWNMVLLRCSGLTRIMLNTLVFFVGVILALLFVVFVGDNYVELFTGAVGREGTLSGRTALWTIAREAITEKPILGWSYDSHQSVFGYQQYFVPYNHYHNGFMDTLVAGGFLLGAALVIHFFQFLSTYLRLSRINATVFPLLLTLVIIVISNLTEYSLLRNNNPLWTVYMVAYFILVALFMRKEEVVPAMPQRRRRGVRRSKKKQLRF